VKVLHLKRKKIPIVWLKQIKLLLTLEYNSKKLTIYTGPHIAALFYCIYTVILVCHVIVIFIL
jgi:hypothetical protein